MSERFDGYSIQIFADDEGCLLMSTLQLIFYYIITITQPKMHRCKLLDLKETIAIV